VCNATLSLQPVHPGVELRANLGLNSHRCHFFEVAFVGELTQETIHFPMGCLKGGSTPRCLHNARNRPPITLPRRTRTKLEMKYTDRTRILLQAYALELKGVPKHSQNSTHPPLPSSYPTMLTTSVLFSGSLIFTGETNFNTTNLTEKGLAKFQCWPKVGVERISRTRRARLRPSTSTFDEKKDGMSDLQTCQPTEPAAALTRLALYARRLLCACHPCPGNAGQGEDHARTKLMGVRTAESRR